MLAIAAFLLKLIYVYVFTSYQESVVNDMAVYWGGAFRNNWGNFYSAEQYAIFPPFYIYLLGYFLRFLFFTGLFPLALPLAITMQIGLYCFSSVFIFLVLKKFTENNYLAFLAQLVYLGSWTALNVNSLILPDNLATPLLVVATGLILTNEMKPQLVAVIGFLLGIAIGAKPSLVFITVGFVWYLAKSAEKNRRALLTIFMLGICLVPLWVTVWNYHLSGGKLVGLGVNGGINFYQGWGRVGKINSQSTDGYFWAHSPGARDELNWKDVNLSEPFSNQRYYYRQGLRSIANRPWVIFEKLSWFKNLFFGTLGPSLIDLPSGYSTGITLFNILIYLMFVYSIYFSIFLVLRDPDPKTKFLLSLIFIFLGTIYALGLPERRYLFYIEYLVIVLFFIGVDRVRRHWNTDADGIKVGALVVSSIFVAIPVTMFVVRRYVG